MGVECPLKTEKWEDSLILNSETLIENRNFMNLDWNKACGAKILAIL